MRKVRCRQPYVHFGETDCRTRTWKIWTTHICKLIVVNHDEANHCKSRWIFHHTNSKKKKRKGWTKCKDSCSCRVWGRWDVGRLTFILESLIAGLVPSPKHWFARALAIAASLTFRKKEKEKEKKKIKHNSHTSLEKNTCSGSIYYESRSIQFKILFPSDKLRSNSQF